MTSCVLVDCGHLDTFRCLKNPNICFLCIFGSVIELSVSRTSTPVREPACRNGFHQSAHFYPGGLHSIGQTVEAPHAPGPPALSRGPSAFPRLAGNSAGNGGGLWSRSGSTEYLLAPSSGSAAEQQENDVTQRTRAVENQYSLY